MHADFIFRLFFPLTINDNPFAPKNQELIEKRSVIRARADEEHYASSGSHYSSGKDSYYYSGYQRRDRDGYRSHYYANSRGYSNARHGHPSHGAPRYTRIDMVKGGGSSSDSINSRSHSPSERDRNGTRHGMRLVDGHGYPKTPNLVPDRDGSSRRKDRRRDKSKHGDTGGSGGSHSSRRRVPVKSKSGRIRIKKRDVENSGKDSNTKKNVSGGKNKNNTVDNDDTDINGDDNKIGKVKSFNVDEAASGSRSTAGPVGVANNSKSSISKMSELSLSSDNAGGGGASPFQMISNIPAIPPGKRFEAQDVEQQLKEQQKLKLRSEQSHVNHEFGIKQRLDNGEHKTSTSTALYQHRSRYISHNGSDVTSAASYSDQSKLGIQIHGTQPVLNNNSNVEIRKEDNFGKQGYLKYFENKKELPSYMMYSLGPNTNTNTNTNNVPSAASSGNKRQLKPDLQTPAEMTNSGSKRGNVNHLISGGNISASTQRSSVRDTASPSPKRINFEDDNSANERDINVNKNNNRKMKNGGESNYFDANSELSSEFFMNLIRPKHNANDIITKSPLWGNTSNSNTPLLRGIGKTLVPVSGLKADNESMVSGPHSDQNSDQNSEESVGSSQLSSNDTEGSNQSGHSRRSPLAGLARNHKTNLLNVGTDALAAVLTEQKKRLKPGQKHEMLKTNVMPLLRKKLSVIEQKEPGLLHGTNLDEWVDASITSAIHHGKIEERTIGAISLPHLLPIILRFLEPYRARKSRTIFTMAWIVQNIKNEFSEYYYDNSIINVLNIVKTAKGLFVVDKDSYNQYKDSGYSENAFGSIKFYLRTARG